MLWNTKLVILDEPTAALGVAQTEQVLNLVRRLADNGLGVLLITHNMNDVMQVADIIATLYLGQMAAQVRSQDVNHTQVVELITAGRCGDLGLAAEAARRASHERHPGPSTPVPSSTSRRRPVRAGSARRRAPTGTASRAATSASLPAVLGVVVLVIVFGVMEPDTFLTEQNFANLLNQGAAIMVLAMGLVFVLLLGEIDLSAGFTAGMGAAILGVTLTKHGWAWPLSRAAPPRLTGVAIGFAIALLVARLGHPVLRRLAGLLPGPAGRDAADHRRGRHDPDPQRGDPGGDEQEHAGRRWAGCCASWSSARVRGGDRSGSIADAPARRAADAGAVAVRAARSVPWPSSWSWSSFLLNQERQRANAPIVIQGVPWVVPLIVAARGRC